MQRRTWLILAIALIWSAATTYLYVSSQPRRHATGAVRYPISQIETKPTLVSLDAHGGIGWTIPVHEEDAVHDIPLRHIHVVKLDAGDYRAYAAIDQDLGCNIVWDESNEQFLNPCHGQRYRLDGTKLSGPGTMPGMTEFASRVDGSDLVIFPERISP